MFRRVAVLAWIHPPNHGPFSLSEVEGPGLVRPPRALDFARAERKGFALTWLVAALALVSCATLPRTSPEVLLQLRTTPHGFVTGTPAALGKPVVLNREDFVFDAQPSPDGKVVAFSRLGVKDFFVAAWSVASEPAKRFDVSVGPSEFDVEELAFSPSGEVVAAASRDAVLRVFDAKTGQLVGAWPAEEPLVSVAFDPSGARLVAGGAKGQVTVLAWPGLGWVAEARAHAGEVRGLAWAKDGTLYSGGWDKQVAAWRLEPHAAAARTARVKLEKKGGAALFRGVLDGAASAAVTVDTRFPLVVIRASLGQAVGLEAAKLPDTVTLQAAGGAQLAHVAHHQSLAFKGLVVEDLEVAVCDACLPPDAQVAVGQAFLERVEVVTDEATGEEVLTAKEGAAGVSASAGAQLVEARRFTLPAYVNDLTVDARGARLGLALSESKAERTLEVYQREKKGVIEPERPWDVGALVDASSGKVLETARGHHGVVATAGISPDGTALATGGWDRTVRVFPGGEALVQKYGLAVRRVRFTSDGTALVVGAWTPQNPLGDHQSEPAATVSEVAWSGAKVETAPALSEAAAAPQR